MTATTGLELLDRPRSTSAAGPATAYAVLLGLLVVAVLASVFLGSRLISPTAVLEAGPDRTVIEVRAVRTVLGLLVGVALGLAGACMQGLTRNPLADPGILGVNAGAALAIVLGISYLGARRDLRPTSCSALVGAAVASVAVHAIAGHRPRRCDARRSSPSPVRRSPRPPAAGPSPCSWSTRPRSTSCGAGRSARSAAGRGTSSSRSRRSSWSAPLLALALSRTLNALALGEEMAAGLGRHTTRDRILVGLAIVLLAGTATAAAGPIAFVGLIVPHLVRTRTGSDHRHLLPAQCRLRRGAGAARRHRRAASCCRPRRCRSGS